MVAEAGSAGCRLSPHSPGRAGRGAHPGTLTRPGRGGVTRTHPGRPGQPRGTTPGPRCRHSCPHRKDYISQHALRETPPHAERCAARCAPGFVVLLAAAAPCRRGRLRRSARCCPSKVGAGGHGSARPQRAALRRRSPPACPLPRAAVGRGRPRHGAVQAQGAAPQVGGAGEAGGAAAGGGRGGREGLGGGAGHAELAPGAARPQVG